MKLVYFHVLYLQPEFCIMKCAVRIHILCIYDKKYIISYVRKIKDFYNLFVEFLFLFNMYLDWVKLMHILYTIVDVKKWNIKSEQLKSFTIKGLETVWNEFDPFYRLHIILIPFGRISLKVFSSASPRIILCNTLHDFEVQIILKVLQKFGNSNGIF